MAQSAKMKSPIGVTLFSDIRPQTNMVWEKWFSTAKLAIVAKDNIQVDKLLRPRPQNPELRHPHEPISEPPTADETTAKKKVTGKTSAYHRRQRPISRLVMG